MKMEKIEHIGIAVKSLDLSIPLFEKLLGSSCYKKESVETEKVNTAFFKSGESKIELLEDAGEKGVINKFIEKRGEGIHHMAFSVKDIREEVARLKSSGFELSRKNPNVGPTTSLFVFYIPKARMAY